jgi:hypothetical protein
MYHFFTEPINPGKSISPSEKLTKAIDDSFICLSHDVDTTIRQITDIALNSKQLSAFQSMIAETDTLNSSPKLYLVYGHNFSLIAFGSLYFIP